MKFVRPLAVALALGTVAIAGSTTLAAPGRRLERLSDELNLTSEQQTQIQAIFERAKAESADERETLRAARTELKSLMAADASDAQLRQQHDLIQELRSDLGDLRFETLLEIRQELTPEQRDRLAELRFERRGRRGDGNRGRAL